MNNFSALAANNSAHAPEDDTTVPEHVACASHNCDTWKGRILLTYQLTYLLTYLPPYLITNLLTYNLLPTYSLIPWTRVILEKLTGFQLVKKFPLFYGTRKFITALTSSRHMSLSWASSIQSIPPHTTSWRSILILSSHLRVGLYIRKLAWTAFKDPVRTAQ